MVSTQSKKGNIMKANSIERKIRQFVRAQFHARVVRGEDGIGQCVAHKNSAKVLITNPRSVFQQMSDLLGKPVASTKNTTVFKVGKLGTIALTTNGDNSVLTLVNSR
jgi:hypothetical protein